ncbi:MAG: hypothetical protein M5R40_07355 [Anaerolineae bacterium]|nr:hypothetical protein [Anaerolineae bacterium]
MRRWRGPARCTSRSSPPGCPKGGGSTRTTICVNLAAALALAGNPVALVDFDQSKATPT